MSTYDLYEFLEEELKIYMELIYFPNIPIMYKDDGIS